jgi:hypothetical protein
MEITPHLSEVELAEFVSDPSQGLGTHLAHCDSCLDKVARLRETVAGLHAAGVEPDEFWIRQQGAIQTKITQSSIAAVPSPSAWRLSRFTWAGAAVVLALAALLVSGGSAPPSHPAPLAAMDPVANDPDHELLLAVEHVMQSSGPEALEPAAFLVNEIRKAQPHATSKNHRQNSPKGDSQ